MKILVLITLLAIFVLETHATSYYRYFSWDPGPPHKWITRDAVNLLIEKEGIKYVALKAFLEELKEGATREE